MSQRLLFVEDIKAQRLLFEEALEEWNTANADKQFELATAETYEAATQMLRTSRYDAALLDLRLPGENGNLLGEELAKACVFHYGIPAAVISGHPADFDQSRFNRMVAIFDKGDGDAYEKAIEWFGGLSHMMTVLSGARQTIQQLGATVFFLRVWPRWSAYERLKGIDDNHLVGIVSRQYASHVADILGIDSEENVKWHPFENYVVPALLEDRPHTGDLFDLDGEFWIVLTPQCDMATEKAVSVLLARCEQKPEKAVWEKYVAGLQPGSSASKRGDADRFFGRLVNQSEPAQHFLPPLHDGLPLMVDFKNLRTIPYADLKQSLNTRVASVANPFLGNLTQRFGAYVSRMGQPNIDTSHFA